MSAARDEILARIKQQLANKQPKDGRDLSGDVYPELPVDRLKYFSNTLQMLKGNVTLCNGEQELKEKIAHFVQSETIGKVVCIDPELSVLIPEDNRQVDFSLDMEAGLTGCEYLVAHTGSVVVSSHQVSGRRMNVFPPIHIVVAKLSQMVDRVEDAMDALFDKYDGTLPSLITNITGPSRTADIEKTLVMGAHGPKALHVFIDTES